MPVKIDKTDLPNYLNVKRYADGTKGMQFAVREIVSAVRSDRMYRS